MWTVSSNGAHVSAANKEQQERVKQESKTKTKRREKRDELTINIGTCQCYARRWIVSASYIKPMCQRFALQPSGPKLTWSTRETKESSLASHCLARFIFVCVSTSYQHLQTWRPRIEEDVDVVGAVIKSKILGRAGLSGKDLQSPYADRDVNWNLSLDFGASANSLEFSSRFSSHCQFTLPIFNWPVKWWCRCLCQRRECPTGRFLFWIPHRQSRLERPACAW